MKGWILLHRKTQEHWLYEDNRPKTKLEAWIHILFTVNFKPSRSMIRGVIYDCDRGQSLYSLERWAKEFNWSIQQVRTFFKQLEKDKMITIEGLQYTTRLTVCNYDSYQTDVTDEQQSEQQTDNIQLTDEQHAANNNRKKEKKGNNGKKELEARAQKFYNEIAEYVNAYPKEVLRKFYDYWVEPNKSGTKMAFELERTWDLSRRLKTWADREVVYRNNKQDKQAPAPAPKPTKMLPA